MDALIGSLNWPAAGLILGLVVVFAFFPQWRALIGRTKKLGKSGLETFDNVQLPAPAEADVAIQNFLRAFDNPLLREQEESIRKDLRDKELDRHPESESVLVRALAATQIALHYERVYSTIWASQVALLNYLNSRADGATAEELKAFYEDAKARFPQLYATYSIENYFGFLRSSNLVTPLADKIAITVAGREFLKWLVETGKAGPYHG